MGTMGFARVRRRIRRSVCHVRVFAAFLGLRADRGPPRRNERVLHRSNLDEVLHVFRLRAVLSHHGLDQVARRCQQDALTEVVGCPGASTNEAMHRMSGHHVGSRFECSGRPLIGDLGRSA